MGLLSWMFSRRGPKESKDAKETEKAEGSKEAAAAKEAGKAGEAKEAAGPKSAEEVKTIGLVDAMKLDGWAKYRAKGLLDTDVFVTARLFSETDPVVDLGTARSGSGCYLAVAETGGAATVFDKATFEGTYEKV